MGDLSERDVEDVLGGVQPPGRDDLAPVVELTTWLHVSREIEPPPAMRDDLFCQIEDGLRVYQRSSRRVPAHLRHRRTSTRVRETLAGSGRPIVSVAAAAVLLVGVILAVRAGGPSREPSALVSPAAQGVPSTTAADTTTTKTAPTTTTTAPTTTSPPTSASDAGQTASDSEQSTTTDGTTESPAPTYAQTGSGSGDDDQAPTTQERSGERHADGTSESGEHRPGRATEPQSDVTDDTEPGNLPLSGWDFDLSEWRTAKALWDALQAEDRGEPRGLRDDPGGESDDERDDGNVGDDDERNDRRSDVGHGERDDEDEVTEHPDADDAEQVPGLSD
jgi:hypothetical protein